MIGQDKKVAESLILKTKKDRINAMLDSLRKSRKEQQELPSTVCCANLQNQLTNQIAIAANAQSLEEKKMIDILQNQLDKQNVLIANQKIEQDKNNLFSANLQSQLDKLMATNANLTARRDQIKNFTLKYSSVHPVFMGKRTPTPSSGYGTLGAVNWVTLNYNTATVNFGNYIPNISTGWMMIPFTGLYYFSWTGSNGEYLTRPKKVDANSTTIYAKLQFRRSLNELLGWAEESTKTHIVIQLMKGWEVRMGVMLEDGLWSKGQYEKFVAYFLG